MTDLREALRRTRSKPLKAALEAAQVKQRELRRTGSDAFRSWQGPWQRELRYRAGDVVSHEGSSWRCLLEHTDSEPPSAVWEYVARKGETGSPGPRGFQGQQGIPGPAGSEVSFQDEGVPLGTASTVNVVGAGASAAVAAGVATITVPGGGSSFAIPQLNADPVAPDPESAWVRRSQAGGGQLLFLFGGGTPITSPGAGAIYELSYRTLQNTTVRVVLA